MRDAGRSRRYVISLWCLTALVLAPAVVIGRVALGGVADETLSVVLAFAGGGHCGPDHTEKLRQAGAPVVIERMADLKSTVQDMIRA